MSAGPTDPLILDIYGADGVSGHSLVPYALLDIGNGVWWALVYDSNYPDDANHHVVFSTTTNTWNYDLGENNGIWSGGEDSHSIGLIALSKYAEQVECTWCSSSLVDTIWLAGQGHLLITDSLGQRIGYVGSQFLSEIPGAYANVVPGGLGIPSEPLYYLPVAGTYTILLDGQTLNQKQTTLSEPSSLSFFGPGFAVSVEDVMVTSSSQDRLIVSTDGRQLDYQSNRAEEVTLSLMPEGANESNEFQVTGADIGPGQIVRLIDNSSNQQFSFNNAQAGSGAYDLKISQVNASGEHIFVHKGISILASDTQYANYGTWDGGLGAMALLIDHGSDGTIDETVLLNNQVSLLYLPLILK
jgi:hypothetical protein